jgi:hypothetical protein
VIEPVAHVGGLMKSATGQSSLYLVGPLLVAGLVLTESLHVFGPDVLPILFQPDLIVPVDRLCNHVRHLLPNRSDLLWRCRSSNRSGCSRSTSLPPSSAHIARTSCQLVTARSDVPAFVLGCAGRAPAQERGVHGPGTGRTGSGTPGEVPAMFRRCVAALVIPLAAVLPRPAQATSLKTIG